MTHRFIGQQVRLKETPHVIMDKEYIQYSVDDPAMVSAIHEEFGSSVRIFTPGTVGTADWKPFRTNVYIDKTGVITDIRNG